MIYVQEAASVLLANKIRSLLTILGLIIGVGAVIAIQVLGSSMAGAVNGLLGGLASNSFIVFPSGQQRDAMQAALKLTDLPILMARVPRITQALPIGGRSELIQRGHQSARFTISPEGAPPFNNLPVLYGRHLDADDIAGHTHVCVISNDVYKRLYPKGGDPTGQSIYAGPNRFVIVGVLQPPKRGFLNASFGGGISIPWTTYVDRYVQGNTIFGARFDAAPGTDIATAETAVIQALRAMRGRPDLQYQTFDKSQFSKGVDGIFGAMTLVVAFIGAVSLLVAGIGIMNIMLVSVAERTREIGVRKAIGARRSQVLAQFFIEALLLCGAGCAIGWAIGMGLGWLVNAFAIVKVTGTVAPLPWLTTVAIAAGFAVVVTLAFGTYPAYRAAKLDPIEALRYE